MKIIVFLTCEKTGPHVIENASVGIHENLEHK